MILRTGINRIGLKNLLRYESLIETNKLFFSAKDKNTNIEENQS